MTQVTARAAVRKSLDAALRPVGCRLVTGREDAAIRRRYHAAVKQVHDAYADRFVPPLPAKDGRVELMGALLGTELAEAMVLLHHLHQALNSGPGDVCEMGVAQGATSALLANEMGDDESRTLWLYDSFAGLSTPTEKDELIDDIFDLGSMDKYAGTMACSADQVRGRLQQVGWPESRTRVVAGYISPDLPPENLPSTVAFAYLDFDLYEPIRTGLDLMHGRCRPGSVIVVDDYDYFSSGPKTAVLEHLDQHPRQYELIEHPAGLSGFCVLRFR